MKKLVIFFQKLFLQKLEQFGTNCKMLSVLLRASKSASKILWRKYISMSELTAFAASSGEAAAAAAAATKTSEDEFWPELDKSWRSVVIMLVDEVVKPSIPNLQQEKLKRNVTRILLQDSITR